jgi:1,4-dihydroxy-2-naphthoyl-CoA synthase
LRKQNSVGVTAAADPQVDLTALTRRSEIDMSVHYESDGPVAVLTIDRPEVANAIDAPTALELADAFRHGIDTLQTGEMVGGLESYEAGSWRTQCRA